MTFATPIWLLTLIPWAGITLWLLVSQRRKVDVPFLDLWEGPVQTERSTRLLHIPPLALFMAILAILLAILAAATPRVAGSGGRKPITVIVDRGVTMPDTRLAELLRDVHPIGARIVDVPQAQVQSALDTRAAILHTITQELARDADGPIIVVSDQSLDRQDDDRIIQISSQQPLRNVGIVRIAARERPAVQAMVRVRNQSPLASAALRIITDGKTTERAIDLPPTDGERDYFIDVPSFGQEIAIELDVADDLPADNRAWLVRERSWPRVEIREPVTAGVRRMIDVYTRLRPPSESSRRVAIVRDATKLAPADPGVVLAAKASEEGESIDLSSVQEQDHPIARGVDWPASAHLAKNPPAGFSPIATVGEKALVAVRSEPSRQVWVGIDDTEWSRSPGFVVFWTNVLDWVGEGTGEQFAWYPVEQLGPEWSPSESTPDDAKRAPGLWPGLYKRSGDGALRAVNALDVRIERAPQPSDWRKRLANLPENSGVLDLAPWAIVLATACLLVSAAEWTKRRLTAFSKPLTV